MWFSNEAWGVYWLTDETATRTERPPTTIPQTAPVREYDRDLDWVYDTFEARQEVTGLRVVYRWLCNQQFQDLSTVEPPRIEFPKVVTLQNLAEFFKAHPKKDSLRLDESTTISAKQGNYFVNTQGNRLIGWGMQEVPHMFWYPSGSLTQVQVDALKKYLGNIWKLSDHDGLVGLEGKDGWVLATQYASFLLDGHVNNKKQYDDDIAAKSIKDHAKLVSNINRYLDAITTDRIRRATAGMTGTTHSILTRCDGCQTCNGMHLEIHMARGDLDAFLIYSAYDAFGPEIYGGAVRQTWDLIADPTSVRVAEFIDVMRKFLLDTIRIKLNGVCFMPIGRRQNCNKWRLFGTEQMRVDGGVRLVQGQQRRDENHDNLRDGEWLAQEAAQQARRRPIPGLRRRVLEFVGGRPEGEAEEPAEPQVGWEDMARERWADMIVGGVQGRPFDLNPGDVAVIQDEMERDPFDMNLDLDENEEDEEF